MSTKKPGKSSTERLRKAAIAEIQERIDGAVAAPPPPPATIPADAAVTETPDTTTTVAGPDGATATAAKGKKGGKAKGAKSAKPAKAPKEKKAKATKAPKPPKAVKPKKVSGLDAAAIVLAESKEPMSAKEIMSEVLTRKLWTTNGETPEATLYAAIIREIAAKKGEARFVKVDRGRFTVNRKAG